MVKRFQIRRGKDGEGDGAVVQTETVDNGEPIICLARNLPWEKVAKRTNGESIENGVRWGNGIAELSLKSPHGNPTAKPTLILNDEGIDYPVGDYGAALFDGFLVLVKPTNGYVDTIHISELGVYDRGHTWETEFNRWDTSVEQTIMMARTLALLGAERQEVEAPVA
jgi:hypothetical protein